MIFKSPENPTISVILAVYNGESEVTQSIFSILHQTYNQFELIVIDDCSTDNTYELLQSIHDPRIKLIQNDTNLGLAKSLNKAIKQASCQFIARHDSGDISFPDRFEKQIAILQNNSNIGLIGTQAIFISDHGTTTTKLELSSKKIKKELLKKNQFVHGSVMFRKELFQAVGGYREVFRYTQDYDLWLRFSETKYELLNVDKTLYKYIISQNDININKTIIQHKTHDYIKQLAAQRRKIGLDDLQKQNYSKINNILKLQNKKFSNDLKNNIYYKKIAYNLYAHQQAYSKAAILYSKAFRYKPWDFKIPYMLLKIVGSYLKKQVEGKL